jgi:hypothetical protein
MARRGRTEEGLPTSIAPLGRDADAGVPGGWNERAEIEEMRRDRAALLAHEKEDRKAWRIDTDRAAFGTEPIEVPQRLRSA